MTDSADKRTSDEADFAALLASYGGALSRIAATYARGPADREDLHQEICLQLWRSLPGFRGESAPGTWLYRVALNTALSWRRKSDRGRRRDHEAGAPPVAGTAASARNEDAILNEFLASLGEADRAVLILYMEGLSPQEMATIVGTTPGAVSVRLHRIRRLYTERYIGS